MDCTLQVAKVATFRYIRHHHNNQYKKKLCPSGAVTPHKVLLCCVRTVIPGLTLEANETLVTA